MDNVARFVLNDGHWLFFALGGILSLILAVLARDARDRRLQQIVCKTQERHQQEYEKQWEEEEQKRRLEWLHEEEKRRVKAEARGERYHLLPYYLPTEGTGGTRRAPRLRFSPEQIKEIKNHDLLGKVLSLLNGFLGVTGPVVLLVAVVAYLYAALIWWPATEKAVPPLQADLSVSPFAGTFTEADSIMLTIQVVNQDQFPISNLSIEFPFTEGIVYDYLHASQPLTRVVNHNLLGEIMTVYYRANVSIDPGERWQVAIPVQLTDYGNWEGAL